MMSQLELMDRAEKRCTDYFRKQRDECTRSVCVSSMFRAALLGEFICSGLGDILAEENPELSTADACALVGEWLATAGQPRH